MRLSTLLQPVTLAIIGSGHITGASQGRERDVFNSAAFQNPPPNVRPRFRYWLPDFSVDTDVVRSDVAAAGSIGAGGVEFVPFFNYGGQLGDMPTGADWSTYNFGTADFRRVFSAALESHYESGLVMDFALGPNQGQGVPADPGDEGLQWDLVPFTESVAKNGSYNGIIPGWGTGELVALVSARVVSNQTISFETFSNVQMANVTYDQFVLAHDTLTDEEAAISSDGQVRLSFPADGSHYRLFAFYQRLSGHKNLDFPPAKNNTIFDQGSYATDHFSGKGAEVVARFWEEHILIHGVAELIAKAGNYAWEDSLELESNISWSKSLPERFEKRTGYSIRLFLPLLAFQQNNLALQPDSPGMFQCVLDTEDRGVRYVNDFRDVLLDGYREYIQTLTDWSHNVLGKEISLQPGYGFPVDMQASIPHVDAPECESLSFLDNIDSYRQFAGPAHLAEKQVISNEVGAVRPAAYRYTLPELLFSTNRGFAGGVNQYVIHGQPYSGSYFETTWPGYTAFRYLFLEMWGPKQPVWQHGFQDLLEYLARVQHVQQTGTPRVDVAMYNKESATTFRTVYQPSDLLVAGWSYTYLSPDNLSLKQAKVQNGVLAPDGPAWRAFVVEATQNVTLDAARHLRQYAASGLPVILSGGSPGLYPHGDATDISEIKAEVSALLASDNVYSVDEGSVADQLASLGLRPRVGVRANGTWYTTSREAKGVTYVLVYADLVGSSGSIVVSSAETPYRLNPWTGAISPVLVYERSGETTTIPVGLAGNQTALFVFSDELRYHYPAPEDHLIAAPPGVIGAEFSAEDGISLHIVASTSALEATLSNGKTVSVDGESVPPAFELDEWTLVAENWESPSNISNDSLPTVKRNTTHYLNRPVSWTNITGLEEASGVGFYNTTFDWPPGDANPGQHGLGAYISFSTVLHALRVEVNGQRIPPLDITNAVADISPYLIEGENTISVTAPTCWWNYLRTVLDQLVVSGAEPLPVFLDEFLGVSLPPAMESGLVGSISITPFKSVVI